jgi:hypothetical protein
VSLNLFQPVGIARYLEVKAPGAGYASLPEIHAFVVLLGAKGRMSEVLKEQKRLFVKRPSDVFGSLMVVA